MTPDFLLQLGAAVCSAAGVYAAIRADLARLGVLAQHAHESAAQAHRRIDQFTNRNH